MTLGGGARLVPSIQVYWQSGSNLRWESADGRWTVDGYVYNAEDKKVYAFAAPAPR